MAAITAGVNRQSKGTPRTRRFLMANSITIPKGAIVIANASGLATNAVSGAGPLGVLGIAGETRTSGTGGADFIQVEYDREYLFAASSISQAMVGTAMLVIDNNTVDETSASSVAVGKLTEFVSNTLGWVYVPGLTF